MNSRAVFADRVIAGDLPRRGHHPYIAPQARGRISPWILDHWRRTGWHVHRVGQAAYVHGPVSGVGPDRKDRPAGDRRPTLHLIVGVWGRRAPAPPWAGRLGRESDGYGRRRARLERQQHGRRFIRDAAGRFLAPLPWWRTPGPRLYAWLEPAPSLFELERGYR